MSAQSASSHDSQHTSPSRNVGETERFLSLLGGGALAIDGLRRGGMMGFAEIAAAGFLGYRGATGSCAMYKALGVDTEQGAGLISSGGTWVEVRRAITIGVPAEQLYTFWRNDENIQQVMSHVREVERIDQRRSHWTVDGPLGTTVQWETEIVDDKPNERIAWRATKKADVANEGAVTFKPAPGDRGTEVSVTIRYQPPLGRLGQAAAAMLQREPGQQLGDDLRNLKRKMETGAGPEATQAEPQVGQRSTSMAQPGAEKRGNGGNGLASSAGQNVTP